MFLSVITPTKNSEKFISDTVESVISQNFEKYEHIILDNLSSDNTLQNIKKFRNNKIKIVSEKDNGIYYAMNRGANLSKGNFLTFLNSDDFILDKDFFKNAYSILNKSSLVGVLFIISFLVKSILFRKFLLLSR
jgi:glycosyltransferase